MKKIIVMGSVGAAILLILISVTSVVSAQITKTTIKEMVSDIQLKKTFYEKLQSFHQMKKKFLIEEWFPGYLLLYLILKIGGQIILWLISGFYQY